MAESFKKKDKAGSLEKDSEILEQSQSAVEGD